MHRDNFKNDLYISGIGQILVIILAFLLNKILSIVLGPVGYSEYSLINKTSAVLSFIMAMSLGIAVPKYLAISRVSWDYSEEFAYFSSAVLIMSIANIIVICVLLLFPDFFMRLLFNSFDNNYLYPLIVFSCGTSIVTVTSSYYRGLDKYISFSAIQIIASFIGVLPIIWISKGIGSYFTLRGIMLIMLSVAYLYSIFSSYIKRGVKISNIKYSRNIGELSSYCLPRVPGEFILFSLSALPLIIINKKFGTFETAAIATGLGLTNAITPFFSIIGTILLPYVSKSLVSGEHNLLNKRINLLIKIYICISTLAFVCILLFPKFFILILFSSEYYQFAEEVKIIAFSMIFQSLYLLLRNPIDASSKFPHNTINLFIALIILVVSFSFAQNLRMLCLSINFVYIYLGVSSLATWYILRKKVTVKPTTH